MQMRGFAGSRSKISTNLFDLEGIRRKPSYLSVVDFAKRSFLSFSISLHTTFRTKRTNHRRRNPPKTPCCCGASAKPRATRMYTLPILPTRGAPDWASTRSFTRTGRICSTTAVYCPDGTSRTSTMPSKWPTGSWASPDCWMPRISTRRVPTRNRS